MVTSIFKRDRMKRFHRVTHAPTGPPATFQFTIAVPSIDDENEPSMMLIIIFRIPENQCRCRTECDAVTDREVHEEFETENVNGR